jgi:hypothetical protein
MAHIILLERRSFRPLSGAERISINGKIELVVARPLKGNEAGSDFHPLRTVGLT